MANIQKLTYPYFTDGSTQLNAQNLNPIIAKLNEMIEAINSGVTPTPTPTYDSDAQAIMNRFSKSLTTAKKEAFNTFIVNLKNSGIYSKIKCLIIPVLANNVTEATQNALTGNSAFSVGGSTLALDSNGGIKPVVDATVAKIASSAFSDASSQNIHMSFYNITGSDETAYWDVALSMTNYNIYTFGLAYAASGVLGSTYKASDDSAVGLPSSVITKTTAKVHAILSFSSSNALLTFNSQGEPTTVAKDKTLTSGLTAGDIEFGQYNGGATYNMTEQDSKSKMMTRATYGLFTIGTSLSQTEAENFNTYVCSFMDSFLG